MFLKYFGVIFWLCEPIRMMILDHIESKTKWVPIASILFYFLVLEVTFKDWDREGKNEQNNNGVLKGFEIM